MIQRSWTLWNRARCIKLITSILTLNTCSLNTINAVIMYFINEYISEVNFICPELNEYFNSHEVVFIKIKHIFHTLFWWNHIILEISSGISDIISQNSSHKLPMCTSAHYIFYNYINMSNAFVLCEIFGVFLQINFCILVSWSSFCAIVLRRCFKLKLIPEDCISFVLYEIELFASFPKYIWIEN